MAALWSSSSKDSKRFNRVAMVSEGKPYHLSSRYLVPPYATFGEAFIAYDRQLSQYNSKCWSHNLTQYQEVVGHC